MSKFIFDNIDKITFNNNNNYTSNQINEIRFDNNKIFTLDQDCLNSLKNNHRDSYKIVAERYIKNREIFELESYNNDYITLRNSHVNNNGIIVTSNQEIFINGGCLCKNENYNFENNIQKEENVISITSLWSSGIWHFPFEAFVALMTIPKDILCQSKIHVSDISNYIIEWLNFLHISESQIITGNIYAINLYLPRMGKCGNPYYSQVNWLKNIVSNTIIKQPFEYLILIKRNVHRKLNNYNELESLLQNFCNNKRLKLYIHDDCNLPSLLEQQQIFSKAKVVFSPHGAGGVNIISMRENAWYIEFLSIQDINICYSRLAYLCNINYKGISMSNLTIDLKKIHNVLFQLQYEIK